MADIKLDVHKVDEAVTHGSTAVQYPRTAVSDAQIGRAHV